MANYNLTNQDIKDTFQQLAQVSGSIEGGITGSGVTDGTGSRITNLHVTASNALSASQATAAVSASHAVNADSSISSSYAVTASYAENAGVSIDTGSLLVTASSVDATITYTKGDGSTFQNIINNVAFSTEAEDLVITVKNTSGVTLAKGTAVHAVGVTGQNVDVIAASNDSAATMPAIGLLGAELTNNSAGTCIIAGRDKGLNTTGLVAGDSVYVHTGGALTSTKPTGSALIQNIGTAAKIDASDGEIIVQGSNRVNDLPNISPGYAWVGNSDGVATAVTTSSFYVTNAVSASYAVSASHEIITEVSSSHAIQADSASYVNPLSQDVTLTGAFNQTGNYETTGNVTSTSGSFLVKKGNNNAISFLIGESGGPYKNNNYYAAYTNAKSLAGQNTAAGLYVIDTGQSDVFVGHISNYSTPFGQADTASFVVQGGAAGDSDYVNTIYYADEQTGRPTFIKSVRFEKPISASAQISASAGIIGDLTGQADSALTASYVNNLTQEVQITGSLLLSQSGLSSGDDVFVLGGPRTGGSSLQGVIRSTVDDGLHLYGNKGFNNGANTFGGGQVYFEAGPINIGSAGSPVNLVLQNGSAITASNGTLPISGSITQQGDHNLSGSLFIGDRTPSQNGYIKWNADLTNDTGIYKNDAGGGQAGGLEFRNTKTLRFIDYNAGNNNDNAGTITNQFDATNGNILEISPYHRLHVRDLLSNARFDVEIPTNISASVDITGSLGVNGNTVITGSYDGTGNLTAQHITARGYLYSMTGDVTSQTGLRAGYGGTGNVIINQANFTGNASALFRAYGNTTNFTNTNVGLNIVDRAANIPELNLKLTSGSALAGATPIHVLNFGGTNGLDGNMAMYSGTGSLAPLHFTKDTVFLSPVTASADVMVSASKVLELQPVGTLNATAPTGSLQVSSSGEIFLWTGGAGAASGVAGWGKLTVTN